jgi:hypothetical protein
MNAEQLKLLAPRVRVVLERSDIKLSHGQSLDLAAVLVGLRNWPEVLAFPDKIAARDVDLPAVERLIDRLYARFGEQLQRRHVHRLKAEHLISELAPWTELSPRDPSLRERLIVASDHSACGNLKQAQLADAVLGALYDFTWGPVPLEVDEDPSRFFDARLAAWDADPDTRDQPEDWKRERAAPMHPVDWSEQLPKIGAYARIELWLDPSPNGQLQLLQLLDALARRPALLDRLFITHVPKPLGGCTPYAARQLNLPITKVGAAEVELATTAWRAYRQPTPQAWARLLHAPLEALPHLRQAVMSLLEELPAADTGLRRTERRILELAAPGRIRPPSLLAEMVRSDAPFKTYAYWELGSLLDGLARSPEPAIQGLDEGPFDLALHDDEARFERYMSSRLSLTDLGQALLAGEADWAAHTKLRYWWGGTKQTPECLWRWNAATGALVAP